jgi:hypothetical protein
VCALIVAGGFLWPRHSAAPPITLTAYPLRCSGGFGSPCTVNGPARTTYRALDQIDLVARFPTNEVGQTVTLYGQMGDGSSNVLAAFSLTPDGRTGTIPPLQACLLGGADQQDATATLAVLLHNKPVAHLTLHAEAGAGQTLGTHCEN